MSKGNGQAAFLGRMTAAATHELRNVLAIIRESAGLISDCIGDLAANEAATPRLQRTLERIDRQVIRGSELLASLNHLSHCPDQTVRLVDLNQEVDCAVLLGQRFARQQGVSLQAARAAGQVSVQLDPLLLQMVLLAAIELLLGGCAGGGTISVQVTGGEHPAVELAAEGELTGLESADSWQRLCCLTGYLAATVVRVDTGRVRIDLAHG